MKDKRIFTQIPNPELQKMVDGTYTPRETRLLLQLYSYHNPATQEAVFPSRNTLSKATKMTPRHISAASRGLESKGGLVKFHTAGKSVRYYLPWNRPLPILGTPTRSKSKTKTKGVPLPKSGTPPLPKSGTLTYQEHIEATNQTENYGWLMDLTEQAQDERCSWG